MRSMRSGWAGWRPTAWRAPASSDMPPAVWAGSGWIGSCFNFTLNNYHFIFTSYIALCTQILLYVTPRFTSEDVSGQNQVKASVQRKIRQSIADEYPGLELVLDDLLPKKSPLIVAKCQNHLNLVVVNNVPLFFNIRDGPYMPTLRLLHQYPTIMKKLQVDRGAIKFVLAGANIMCPGLTSPGGILDEEVGAETPVAIMAEGKQHALAIGFTKMSAKDM
ncbi:hypothetical protein OSB04_011724 [Centaurea solstitialis]|uniref:PUA domain-containing protein n=1 Tax=Centaurea solstitialis TaxID=347529 RepID=A0AA38TLQ8_9ASTR|nr:hypothetical protein OSB04_011724 [Centaurea solstitialis]